MNFYQFLKDIQDGVGDGCIVNACLTEADGTDLATGLRVQIDWPNDLHFRFVVKETELEDERVLKHLRDYVIHEASKRFRIADVGED